MLKNLFNLGKKKNKRAGKFINLEHANSIALLCCGDNEIDFKKIKSYIKELEDIGKYVTALVSADKEEKISSYVYKKEVNFYLSTKKLNSLKKDENITNFINKKPDILMNLCVNQTKITEYIQIETKAKFKISGITEDENADFIIEIGEKKDIEYLFRQIIKYLKIIKQAD